ncbi:MAG: hypothetical protein D6768_19320, partial [Chloroflexi bacterium]
FPLVAIIAPDVPQSVTLLDLFRARQRGRFITCVTTWGEFQAAPDILTAPIWTTWRRGKSGQKQSLATLAD